MIRAMYAGISGLKANQTKLDVTGNNIANVNTTAFKAQRIRFQDTLNQNITQATGPSLNIGGTNPRQVGLGVQIAGIDTIVSQGNMQPTSRNLDAMIDGEGYFVVGRGANNETMTIDSTDHAINGGKMKTMFTRDGSLTLDEDGNLLTSDGYRIMGYSLTDGGANKDSITHDKTVGGVATDKPVLHFVDGNSPGLKVGDASKDALVPLAIPDTVIKKVKNPSTGVLEDADVKITNFSIDSNGVIKAQLEDNSTAAIGQIAMVAFKNPAGLSKSGKNILEKSSNSGEAILRTPVGTGKVAGDTTKPNDDAFGNMRQGYLEMSNVDLAEQFTDMIVASRSFQANGKIITASDEILQELVNLKR